MELLTNLKSNLKSFRNTTDFSQEKMAEELHVSHSHYSKLETGENTPSLELLCEICEYFDVPLDFFVKKDGFAKSNAYANIEILERLKKIEPEKMDLLTDILHSLYFEYNNKQ